MTVNSAPKFKLTTHIGDLFSAAEKTNAALAHCVSECMTMGKGIATEFVKRFGHKQELIDQGIKVGGVASLCTSYSSTTSTMSTPSTTTNTCTTSTRKKRFIFYLVTKHHYFQKPTYKSLEASLIELKRLCQLNSITRLCIPKLGCGLDKLGWNQVSRLICEIFKSSDIVIDVYSLK